MRKDVLVKAFITLPVAEAVVGMEISGVRAFPREEMKQRIKALNGQAEFFKVAELEIPENGCKVFNTGSVMIPRTSRAVIKKCHSVKEFIDQQ